MAYLTSPEVGIDLTAQDIVPRQSLGSRFFAAGNASEYIYCTTTTAFAAGDLCYLTDDGTYTLTAATTTNTAIGTNMPVALAVPQVTYVAPVNTFGVAATTWYVWAFKGAGAFSLSVANGVSAHVKLTTTGTTKVAGTGGNAIGAGTVGNTSGGAAVITCYAPAGLAYNP